MSTLLGLCGSLRAASLNAKLMEEAGAHWPGSFLKADLRLPLYDADLEAQGLPDAVTALGDAVRAADAVVIACPEYNKAPPGVLKNALDWISRAPGQVLSGKPVAIVSATAGRAGGERTQTMLRAMLHPFGAEVLTGPEVLVAAAKDQFDDEDRLTNDINAKALAQLIEALHKRVP